MRERYSIKRAALRALFITVLTLLYSASSAIAIEAVPALSSEESLPDDSVYQLESSWTDQSGNTLQLKQFCGKPVVLAMFYVSCEYSCPATVAMLKKIEAKLSPTARSATRFVMVTFDPARDSEAVLTEAMRKRGLDGRSWTMLRGSPEDTRELAVMLGIKYKDAEAGVISHSNVISVLDSHGRRAYQHQGVDYEVTPAVSVIESLITH